MKKLIVVMLFLIANGCNHHPDKKSDVVDHYDLRIPLDRYLLTHTGRANSAFYYSKAVIKVFHSVDGVHYVVSDSLVLLSSDVSIRNFTRPLNSRITEEDERLYREYNCGLYFIDTAK